MIIMLHMKWNTGANIQLWLHRQTHPAIFNQSSQKSVCLKYLGSCNYYSKTRTCRSTAEIFCLLLTTGLLRAKKEEQKCIKVVLLLESWTTSIQDRSLSFNSSLLLKIRLSKVLGLLGTFTTTNLLFSSENFVRKKKSRITRQQLALHLHNESVHDIGWFSPSHDFFLPCRYVQLLWWRTFTVKISILVPLWKSFFILFPSDMPGPPWQWPLLSPPTQSEEKNILS